MEPFVLQKIEKKSSSFWKHGKHKGTLRGILGEERKKKKLAKEPMSNSVQELMNAERSTKQR